MIGKGKIPQTLFSEETRACGGVVRLGQDYRGMDQTFHRWYDRLEAGFIMTMAACNLVRFLNCWWRHGGRGHLAMDGGTSVRLRRAGNDFRSEKIARMRRSIRLLLEKSGLFWLFSRLNEMWPGWATFAKSSNGDFSSSPTNETPLDSDPGQPA